MLASDLDNLSDVPGRASFGYQTGGVPGLRLRGAGAALPVKGDYNLNTSNKVTFRYTHLDSITDVLVVQLVVARASATASASTQAMNFQNSNYQIMENIRSGVGEWNSTYGNTMANSLIVGYTKQDESRSVRGDGKLFPLVDILDAGTTYTSFGFEPFTPNNELRYKTFQLQNNFTKFANKHTLTFGGTAERYESENVFFPGSQSVYSYNSLADFYTDANDYLANPNRTTSPVSLRRFQVRWSNIPGQDEADPAARGVVRRRLRAGRVGGPRQPQDHRGHPLRRAQLRRHGLRQPAGRRADVPRRGRPAGAVLDGQAARPEVPVVAARRLQLGGRREPQHAGARRHGHLHRQARRTCGSRTRSATPAC